MADLIIVKCYTSGYPAPFSLFANDGDRWELVASDSTAVGDSNLRLYAHDDLNAETRAPKFERVMAADIVVGDLIGRSRTRPVSWVAEVSRGPIATTFKSLQGQTIARPRFTAQWWRVV